MAIARPEIYVVKLVTDDELLLNVGADRGVKPGDLYEILDPVTQDVHDPLTGASLGSIDRVTARVSILKVGEHMSLARVFGRRASGLSGVSQVLAGATQVVSSPSQWLEGVRPGHPARDTGQAISQK